MTPNVLALASTAPVVHVSDGSYIVPGLIGGAVVLVGAFLADLLSRWRDRRTRLEEGVWGLLTISATTLPDDKVEHMPLDQLGAGYTSFVHDLIRVRTYARWPVRKAAQIRAEVDEILVRFSVAVDKWNTGDAGPPRVGAIMGGQLAGLVFPGKSNLTHLLNSVLRAEGRPTPEERGVGDQGVPKVGERDEQRTKRGTDYRQGSCHGACHDPKALKVVRLFTAIAL